MVAFEGMVNRGDEDAPTVVDAAQRDAGDAHPLLFGQRWRAIALLGTGGMGSVYLARDAQLEELVALKMVRSQLVLYPEMIARFRDEVRLSRAVSSPYVARTHDLGEHDGCLFLTMQYVDGETLAARVKREGALAVGDLVRIAHDLSAGLDAVHEAGVVHRDLKPANVMLAKDGRAVITDFGIALREADRRRDTAGTPMYAAPEQIQGGVVSARADIYALGALLFVAATGHKPFDVRVGDEPPPDPRSHVPTLPRAFASVILRAMAVDPSERYASAGALYDALAPLASFGARVEDRLFDFVRGISREPRRVAVDLTHERDTSGPASRGAIAEHFASRLSESGEVLVVADRTRAEASLEGSIREDNDLCSIELLLRSHEGDVFFQQRLTGRHASLAKLIDEAVFGVARALGANAMGATEQAAFRSRAVADLFLEAKEEYRQFTAHNVDRAIELFERANMLEPDNSTLLAWKGCALARWRFFHDGPDLAHDVVARALLLGSHEAAPYVALGENCLLDMRPVDAAHNFVTALKRAPGLVDLRTTFANLLAELGALEPAVRLSKALHASNPSYAAVLEPVMRAHALHGAFDRAHAVAMSLPADASGAMRLHIASLRFAVWARDRDAFVRVLAGIPVEKFDAYGQAFVAVMQSAMLHGTPPPRELDAVVASLTPRRQAFILQCIVEVAALLHDDALFFEALDRAVATGVFDVRRIELVSALRPAPRLAALRNCTALDSPPRL